MQNLGSAGFGNKALSVHLIRAAQNGCTKNQDETV